MYYSWIHYVLSLQPIIYKVIDITWSYATSYSNCGIQDILLPSEVFSYWHFNILTLKMQQEIIA